MLTASSTSWPTKCSRRFLPVSQNFPSFSFLFVCFRLEKKPISIPFSQVLTSIPIPDSHVFSALPFSQSANVGLDASHLERYFCNVIHYIEATHKRQCIPTFCSTKTDSEKHDFRSLYFVSVKTAKCIAWKRINYPPGILFHGLSRSYLV